MSRTRRALTVERRAIWQKGHLAKDCWEKHPDKKPTAKPKAKGQPTKPGGKQR